MKKYQVFISYRRDGGYDLAGRIRDRLVALGYSVFLDVESMRSGKFNEQLYDAIEECNDFLLVLPPNGLDRCTNPEDWVRLEIAHALKCQKNVVPIMARGFEFPETLPEDIDDIRHMDAVRASVEYFDAVIEKIETHLRSRRRGKARPAAPKTPKSPKESTVPKPSGEIPLPRFLKVQENSFLQRVQSYLSIINPAHEDFVEDQVLLWASGMKEYLASRKEEYLASHRQEDWEAYLAEQKKLYGWKDSWEASVREEFLRGYDPTCWEELYELARNFDETVARKLKATRFSLIHDRTLLEQSTQKKLAELHTIRDYVSYLYDAKPAYYQTRVAELATLPFFLNHRDPLFSGLRLNDEVDYHLMMKAHLLPCRSILEHIFQGIHVERMIGFITLQDVHHSDYSLGQVSFSVQTILQTVPNQAGQNEEIRRFLTSLFALYQFLDSDTPWAPKKLRKYLLVNYKYLLSQNVRLTKETTDLFRTMLEACNR